MLAVFAPLIAAARDVDLSDPDRARTELERRLAPGSPAALELNRALVALLEAGQVAQRGEPPVRWSRVSKSTPETDGFSIDVVDMTGPGPRHRHPNGEVNWCIALEGQPTFDGQPAGWVVEPPSSEHVPTVAGGRMLIVYLLPAGAIEFAS
jgi:hypothetical protein